MPPEKIRDYGQVQSRWENSLANSTSMLNLGMFSGIDRKYECFKFVLGEGNSRKILISAGIHGDEPAGVETVCVFLEDKLYKKYLETWEIVILPCLNPTGYEYGSRNNYADKDLNRLFKADDPPEEVCFAQSVFTCSFTLTLELHEDTESSGYYLYQKTRPDSFAGPGRSVLDSVKNVMPLNLDRDIDGSQAVDGLIDRLKGPEDMDWWPMALYALSRGTGCCLTLETGTGFSMGTRVSAHLRAIDTAIDFFS